LISTKINTSPFQGTTTDCTPIRGASGKTLPNVSRIWSLGTPEESKDWIEQRGSVKNDFLEFRSLVIASARVQTIISSYQASNLSIAYLPIEKSEEREIKCLQNRAAVKKKSILEAYKEVTRSMTASLVVKSLNFLIGGRGSPPIVPLAMTTNTEGGSTRS
jgi:hypothetical protein